MTPTDTDRQRLAEIEALAGEWSSGKIVRGFASRADTTWLAAQLRAAWDELARHAADVLAEREAIAREAELEAERTPAVPALRWFAQRIRCAKHTTAD